MHTLYIHIGTPKTGTSAFQNWMYTNEGLLSSVGITYFNELIHQEQERKHWQIAYNLWKFSNKRKDIAYVDDLVDYFAKEPMPFGFLSAEELSFWIRIGGGFRYLVERCRKKGITCHVVAVVRNPLEYLISAYGEDVVGGNCPLNLPDWLMSFQGKGHSRVIDSLKKWENLIPAENFHWIQYESEQIFPQKILEYLFGDIFKELPNIHNNIPLKVRESLDGTTIEIYRRINKIIIPNYNVESSPPNIRVVVV